MTDSPKQQPDPNDKSLGEQVTSSDVSRQAWKKRLDAHRKKSLGEQSTRSNPLQSRSDLSDLRPENKPASIDKSLGDQATGADVFLSHSTQNTTVADAVCATLERRGIRCWVAPRDIPLTTNWAAAIIDGINASKMMVVILSSDSNISPEVVREVDRAVNKRIPIISLRIEDIQLSKELEYFLSAAHWLDALTPPFQDHLDTLADRVATLLSGEYTAADIQPAPKDLPVPEASPFNEPMVESPRPQAKKTPVKTAPTAKASAAKEESLDGLSVSYSSFQNNPLIVFSRPKKRPFQFGVSKAKRLVAGIECCTAEEFSQTLSGFVEKGAQTEIKIPSVRIGDWQNHPVLQFYFSVECTNQPFSFGHSKAQAILSFVTQTSVEKLHSVLADFIDTTP